MTTFIHKSLTAMLCIMILGNTACTSMTTIDATSSAVAANNIEVGDTVTLVYKDGSRSRITIDAIDETSVRGSAVDGSVVVADFRELEEIQARQYDGSKTARNTGKGVGYALLGIFLLGAAVADAFGGAYGG